MGGKREGRGGTSGEGTKAELSLAPSAADGLLQSVLLYFSTHFAFHETAMIIVAKKCKSMENYISPHR